MNTAVHILVILSMLLSAMSPVLMHSPQNLNSWDRSLPLEEVTPTPTGIETALPQEATEIPTQPSSEIALTPEPTATPTPTNSSSSESPSTQIPTDIPFQESATPTTPVEITPTLTQTPAVTETPFSGLPTAIPTETATLTPTVTVTNTPTVMPSTTPTSTETVTSTPEEDSKEMKIKKGGGKISGLDGKVEVEVPEGAIQEDAVFTINPLDPETEDRVKGGKTAFEIKANGNESKKEINKFNQDLILTIHYNDDDIPGNEKSLSVFYYDEGLETWLPIPSWVDEEANILYARSNHLTVFNYKIHDMEISRLPSVQNFQVSSFTGAAAYSYPIEVPPGPGGFQPSLTLSYNSQAVDDATETTQASWVGMGWSLETGSITRNMNGTSDYLGDDTFTMTVGDFSSPLILGTDGKYHTKDENFWRIQRNGADADGAEFGDTWTAWDKEGNIYTFGEWYPRSMIDNTLLGLEYSIPRRDSNATSYTSNALFPTYNFESCNGFYQGNQNSIWPLTKVTNRFNQSITYTYYYDMHPTGVQLDSGCDVGFRDFVTAIYPQTITYPNNRYRIHFILTDRTDYYLSWPTRQSRVPYQRRLLQEIRIEHNSLGFGSTSGTIEVVRKYVFSYSTDTNNMIFPSYTWSNGLGSGGKTPTLIQIQEIGVNNATLPPSTFTYGDKMHMTKATNGYGGEVSFTYEAEPWYPNNSGVSRSRVDYIGSSNDYSYRLCDNLGHDNWSAETGSIYCDNKQLKFTGRIKRTFNPTYDGGYLRPGGAYQVQAPATAGTVVKIRDQSSTDGYTAIRIIDGLGPIFILPKDANKVEILLECPGGTCSMQGAFAVRFLLTRYRVIKKTLTDSVTNVNYEYLFDYQATTDRNQPTESLRNAKTNLPNSIASPCPALNPYSSSSYCFNEAYTQFWGHAQVIETAPNGRQNTTYFAQSNEALGRITQVDTRDGSGVLLSSTIRSYEDRRDDVEDPGIGSPLFPRRSNKPVFPDLLIYFTYLGSIAQVFFCKFFQIIPLVS